MICRSCGTEIADKAIVCYRCGAPTSAPAPRPTSRGGTRPVALRGVIVAVMFVIVVAAVLVVPRLAPGAPRVAAYLGVALAVVVAIHLLRAPRAR
jgi:hypothetical protein